MASGKEPYEEVVAHLASYLSLNEEAILIAEGWSILPPGIQRHVKLLIDDYIASQHPLLQRMYAAASAHDQQRINRILEDVQRRRGPPARE